MTLSNNHTLTTRLCAAFAIALGAMTLFGWALGIPLIVQIRPDWTPMVVNTAIGFVLGGTGLLMSSLRNRWFTPVAAMLGMLVVLLAVEELCVLAFDIAPALSLPDLHRPLQPGYPHPGRMAPNTALCFLLFGAGLLALARPHVQSVAHWVQRAAVAVLAIGLLGVVGYSLQLEYLYGWAGVTRMAVHTGVGMFVLGIGLWNLVRARAGALPIFEGEEVAGVYRAATVLLWLVAACAGVGGFAFLQSQVEQQVQDDLLHMTVSDIALFEQIIRDRSGRASVVSDDEALATQLRKLTAAQPNTATPSALQSRVGSLLANGFSSVGADIDGRHWQFGGVPVRPTLAVALHGDNPGWMLWDDGYVLRRTLPVHDAAGMVGVLITEQRLHALDAMSAAANRLGETDEMAVCGADATMLHCFPLRSRPEPFSVARVVAGRPLPMNYAFRGKTGTITAFDYRQHRVLAAYGPIGQTGLALVVKRDIAEIYAPIRRQFQRIVLFLGTLLLIGRWVLLRRLRPLLRALEESRTQAQANGARFEAAVESNLDAFFILECMRDATGAVLDLRYVHVNARAERVLRRSRAEIIGHGMCELFPERRSDGMLAIYVHAVETGEHIVEERSAVAHNGQTRWYGLQAVKLGDGLGVTVRDITKARHAANRIRHQALHDPLTGLANRAGFELALAGAIAEAHQHGQVAAVALLDLDDFKQINDTLGHAAGDQVLQLVATRLRNCMRPSDTVARLGGDEFVLVLPNISYPAGAEIVARKLIAQVAEPMQVDGRAITVTVSVGISAFPYDGPDASILLKCADSAMYRTKRAGRNGYALSNGMSN